MGMHKELFSSLHKKPQQCQRFLNATVTQPVTRCIGKEKLEREVLSLLAGLWDKWSLRNSQCVEKRRNDIKACRRKVAMVWCVFSPTPLFRARKKMNDGRFHQFFLKWMNEAFPKKTVSQHEWLHHTIWRHNQTLETQIVISSSQCTKTQDESEFWGCIFTFKVLTDGMDCVRPA